MRLRSGVAVAPADQTDPVKLAQTSPKQDTEGYLSLYSLTRAPFRPSAEPARDFLLFDSRRPVLEALVGSILRGDGHVVLIGEDGSGKTMVMRTAITLAMKEGVRVKSITGAGWSRKDADPAANDDRLSPTDVLAIDDAQDLPEDALCNLPAGQRLLLVGTEAVTQMLRRPANRLVASRITATQRLVRLAPQETRRYIEHRLWQAGGSVRRILSQAAVRQVIRAGEGRPGQINLILEAALNTGFLRGEPAITPRTVRAALSAPGLRATRRSQPILPIVGWSVAAVLLVAIAASWLSLVSWDELGAGFISTAETTPAALPADASSPAPPAASQSTPGVQPAPATPRSPMPQQMAATGANPAAQVAPSVAVATPPAPSALPAPEVLPTPPIPPAPPPIVARVPPPPPPPPEALPLPPSPPADLLSAAALPPPPPAPPVAALLQPPSPLAVSPAPPLPLAEAPSPATPAAPAPANPVPSGSSQVAVAPLPANDRRQDTRSREPAPMPRLAPEVIETLIRRGEAMLSVGDVSAARSLFLRAAEAGSAKAATATGMTFDPNFLMQAGAVGIPGEPARAEHWYRTALALGDTAAEPLLRRLGAPVDQTGPGPR